jgi:predicted TIM-barrel fold metal-dependent hydrolase
MEREIDAIMKMDIPQADREKIYRKNAEKLLHLSVK